MTKNEWVQPRTVVQQFVANEYVSACGDTNNEYIFQCDAMGGILGAVFYSDGDDNFEPPLFGNGEDRMMGLGYQACGEKHITQVGDDFIEGWYVTGWGAITGGSIAKKVIIWRGADGNNIHCTTNLDKNSWETAKS